MRNLLETASVILIEVLSVIAIPLGLFNLFGGIVVGIWLMVLGEWGIVGYGILFMVVSVPILTVAIIPGMLFMLPISAIHDKDSMVNTVLGFICGCLYALYVTGVLVVWCVLVLFYYMEQANSQSIIPILIWSYNVANAPIVFLGDTELQSGNEYIKIFILFIQVAYILAILGILFLDISMQDIAILFAIMIPVGFVAKLFVSFVDST